MGDVRRLTRCYRCRKVFAARRDERYCPDCRREIQRERNRRRLQVGSLRSGWGPLLLMAALTVVGGMWSRTGAWVGAAMGFFAIWHLGRGA